MSRYYLDLRAADRTQIARVGGKAAHLGELWRLDGIVVPAGFCITTEAFERVCAEAPDVDVVRERLSRLASGERSALHPLSAALRAIIEAIAIPDDLVDAITQAWAPFGDSVAVAVRSSATAEDLPDASFAGQHDSYLDVRGITDVLHHVRRCWASLFSERAVTYRQSRGYDPRATRMAVIVQAMVPAQAAGVLFTADPLSGNRRLACVEACRGLGDAFVGGTRDADVFHVRDGCVVATRLASSPFVEPASGDGERLTQPVLTDAQVLQLVEQGRRIEAHFGQPQDIEWCLHSEAFHVVQSRPITTLYPIPANTATGNRVYVSVGHQQMMTDVMRPLGLSVRQLTARTPMHEAGGRLFVDVTRGLSSAAGRATLFGLLGRSDPLIGDALQTLIERDFVRLESDDAAPSVEPPAIDLPDPAALIAQCESSIAALARELQTKSGVAALDFIRDDFAEMHRILFDPRSHVALMAGIDASWWLNERMQAWLGETNAADTLTLSAPGNITSEMGLALLDVADAIRPYPDVVAFLEQTDREDFLIAMIALQGGRDAHDAIQSWLDRYGMRGVAEIDITAPRWNERPALLIPLLRGHLRNFASGESRRRFEHGRQQAHAMEQSLLQRLHALPDGEHKARETKRRIDQLRHYIGYREYPKYGLVSRYFVYKRALLAEAATLVEEGVIDDLRDIDFLTFDELHDVVRTRRVDREHLRHRKIAFAAHQSLSPPRVLTSEGECLDGAYHRDEAPREALIGLPVSVGIVEGRARVIRDLVHADLDAEDILITPYTDPSWTPLFVTIKGLVTEVGGLMTHGAVVAREYGLPAVVGVKNATRLIRDGQRVRVNGREGFVEILS